MAEPCLRHEVRGGTNSEPASAPHSWQPSPRQGRGEGTWLLLWHRLAPPVVPEARKEVVPEARKEVVPEARKEITSSRTRMGERPAEMVRDPGALPQTLLK